MGREGGWVGWGRVCGGQVTGSVVSSKKPPSELDFFMSPDLFIYFPFIINVNR